MTHNPCPSEKMYDKEFEAVYNGPITDDYGEECQRLADMLKPHSYFEYVFRKYILGEYLTMDDIVRKQKPNRTRE